MNPHNVLVVSNNPEQRAQVVNFLVSQRPDYQCHEVEGKNVLTALQRGRWHMLVADLDMSEITGLQLIDAVSLLKRRPKLLLRSLQDHCLAASVSAHARHKGVHLHMVQGNSLLPADLQALSQMVDKTCGQAATGLMPCAFIEHIEAYFQPVHCAMTGALHGGEALMRWTVPGGKVQGAESLSLLLQSSKFRLHLWEKMFDRCIHLLRAIEGRRLCMAVNVSSDVASSVAWAEKVAQRLAENQLLPEQLAIEVTEEGSADFDVDLVGCISQLRLRGIHCSIDDFGIGFSSLLRLARTPFSTLKIDRQFITQARSSSRAEIILKSITDLAHDLGLKVVAEGIETKEDLDRIRHLGCDLAQGYYYAKPMPAMDFLHYSNSTLKAPTDYQSSLK